MESFEQEKVSFYAGDFLFHFSKQVAGNTESLFPYHWHKYIEILYCVSGVVHVVVENAEYHMTSGDIVLIGPNVVHRTLRGNGSILYNILFDTSVVQYEPVSTKEAKCVNSFLNNLSSFNYYYLDKKNAPIGIEQLLQKIERRYRDEKDYVCIYLRAYLMELIGMFCEIGLINVANDAVSNHTLNAVKKTASYIQSHCNEKITLADMAMKANLSYHYYARLFKQVTGKTFALYLASARVFMAERLMLEGKYSLQEIAVKVGLYPQSYFNHTYKRLRGFSPKEFLKRSTNYTECS